MKEKSEISFLMIMFFIQHNKYDESDALKVVRLRWYGECKQNKAKAHKFQYGKRKIRTGLCLICI